MERESLLRALDSLDGITIEKCILYSSLIYDNPLYFNKYEILSRNSNNSFFNPIWVCFRKYDDLYIVIRGTYSKEDIITDLFVNEIKATNSEMIFHTGFYFSATRIFDSVKDIINSHNGRVFITGHSYGGSVASVLCALIQSSQDVFNKNVRAICFGPAPSIGNLEGYIKPYIISFVNNDDIVPNLCAKNVLDPFVKIGKSIKFVGICAVYEHFLIAKWLMRKNRKFRNIFNGVDNSIVEKGGEVIEDIRKGADYKVKEVDGCVIFIDDDDESCPIKFGKKFHTVCSTKQVFDDHRVSNYFIKIIENLRR